MRCCVPSLLSLALVACSPNVWSQVDLAFEGTGEVVTGQFVVAGPLSDADADALGIDKVDQNEAIGATLVRAPDGVALSDLQDALTHAGRGEVYVEPNRPTHALDVSDPYFGYQWDMHALDIEEAWTLSTGQGILVAVVDTGVSSRGEDTPHLVGGYDFVDGDSNPDDIEGHGTHVAGTIAQATDNGKGCVGMAPDASVLPVRVLGPYGGDTWTVARGIAYAVDEGADVINLSLGSAYGASVLEDAIDYAVAADVVVVAASGNESASVVGYPAAYDGVIAVGATDQDGRVPFYSNGGSALDVVAPGSSILQEYVDANSAGYAYLDGTSMASPHVAGLAALVLAAGADPADVGHLITSTATDLGPSGWDPESGYGQIDPVQALIEVGGVVTPPDPPGVPADTAAPVISGIGGERSGTSLTLWWTTDEPATSEIEFDGYGRFGDPNTLSTAHELRFRIASNGSYEFRAIAVDAAGNESRSPWWVTSP